MLLSFVTDHLVVATDYFQSAVEFNALFSKFLLESVDVEWHLALLLLKLLQSWELSDFLIKLNNVFLDNSVSDLRLVAQQGLINLLEVVFNSFAILLELCVRDLTLLNALPQLSCNLNIFKGHFVELPIQLNFKLLEAVGGSFLLLDPPLILLLSFISDTFNLGCKFLKHQWLN